MCRLSGADREGSRVDRDSTFYWGKQKQKIKPFLDSFSNYGPEATIHTASEIKLISCLHPNTILVTVLYSTPKTATAGLPSLYSVL